MNRLDLRRILSKNIKDKRKLFALTQENLAEKTGLSAQTINDIEGCRTWVSDNTLVKIADALITTPSELLVFNENEIEETDIMKFKCKIQNVLYKTIDEMFDSFNSKNNESK